MIEINLVPDVKQELIKAQRIRATVISFSIIIGIAAVAAVTLLAIYAYAFQGIRSASLDTEISKQSGELSKVTDLSKTLTIQNQLTKISQLRDDIKINSRVFDVIGAIIPPSPNEVQISNLLIDSTAGTITIEGQAANSYAAVEVLKKTIEGANVTYTLDEEQQTVQLASDVTTGDTSYGEDSSGAKVLRFTLSFVYAPELFSTLSENASVSIGTSGNATDSFLGVPNSVFVDRAKDLEGEG